VPTPGIANYALVCQKYADLVNTHGRQIRTRCEILGFRRSAPDNLIETTHGTFSSRDVLNCTGLQSDRISVLAGEKTDLQIVPFRGEYYEIVPKRRNLVRSLIYPAPEPSSERHRSWYRKFRLRTYLRVARDVRAEALRSDRSSVDDFVFTCSRSTLHVRNVPSPAATASIPIGKEIARMAEQQFGLESRREMSIR
jgi:L-2-hydroxyglutarate oxidase LhgO